ncbi:carbamoyltransferase HypF [Bacillota bacterium LX-D]|nr:carbamoyltransferase HypF [Bacillota bacterium LX-D]
MLTADIRIWGIVQGVGFRPFIARLATEHGLKGSVANEGGSVHILATGSKESLENFLQDIHRKKPLPAEIIHLETRYQEKEVQEDTFKIVTSSTRDKDLIFIPPDLAICEECRQELFRPDDQRYRHPFISCMLCGPRYTIMDHVPYDRDTTSMVDFPMCDFCYSQYSDSSNRRFHAQTISCHNCGPQLIYRPLPSGEEIKEQEALEHAAISLKKGEIIAIKGIGGYHLACIPFDETAVLKLRELKVREEKPFAVMFSDIAEIKDYCHVSEFEAHVLSGRERPIVLLEQISNQTKPLAPAVLMDSRFVGAFLPYTPLHYLLLEKTGPLIMTSANLSDEPIIKDDAEIFNLQHPFLSGVLYNKRRIIISIDDSVVKCFKNNTQFLRRARGYVPLPIALGKSTQIDLLACGGELKNTFCLVKRNFAYLSQHIGDLEREENFQAFEKTMLRMEELLEISPSIVSCDLHPNYYTTRFAKKFGLELVQVQHHYAHIAAVMAEKQLDEEVIGVAFDGTGYGTDGKIWGGEFLLCSPLDFSRVGHLQYIPLPGGDLSVKEGWKTAYMYLYQAGLEDTINDGRWPILKAALLNNINMHESSSMGRLFDAVAVILGIRQQASYEGQLAILLENAAAQYLLGGRELGSYDYTILENDHELVIDVFPCIRQMVAEQKQGKEITSIAYRFHRTVACFTVEMCTKLREKYKINKVAISGGVFQNSILFTQTVHDLERQGFEVLYNTKVPPNDGGISLGQAYVTLNKYNQGLF